MGHPTSVLLFVKLTPRPQPENSTEDEEDSRYLRHELALFIISFKNEQPAGPYQDSLAPYQFLSGTGFQGRGYINTKTWKSKVVDGALIPQPAIRLTVQDNTRITMAWHAFRLLRGESNDRPALLEQRACTVFNERLADFPNLNDFRGLAIEFGFCAAACVYGGLHTLAWSANFRTPIERLLWRTSACIIIGGMMIVFASLLLELVLDKMENATHSLWPNDFSFKRSSFMRSILYILRFTLWGLAMSVLLVYILARVYLVIECFISLLYLPADAYEVPEWSVYFPHIS